MSNWIKFQGQKTQLRMAWISLAPMLGVIPLEIQCQSSIPKLEVMTIEEVDKDEWTVHIKSYIEKGSLPKEKGVAMMLRYQKFKYVIYDGNLYKRGFNQPLLKCGNHSGVLPWITKF